MGVLEAIGGFFTGLAGIPAEVLKAAEAAWNAIKTVWAFLTRAGQVLDSAWTWMVHGAEDLGGMLEAWVGEAFNALWVTLTQTIPGAISWVFLEAVHWAGRAVKHAWDVLAKSIHDVKQWLAELIHRLVGIVKAALGQFIHWATSPIRWVLHWGAWIVNLLTHPDHLAKWVAGAIIEPIVEWLLSAGSAVFVWLLRKAADASSAFAHVIEDAISKVL